LSPVFSSHCRLPFRILAKGVKMRWITGYWGKVAGMDLRESRRALDPPKYLISKIQN